ncbi:hypothetical protein [Actinoplanes aureus]|uniref:Uncharacterized protein n=1 Tax=Actinoplanes aureus TaxID=2792083 RepID=A0A931C953_9ACTN|nr:hypothetical protein [Actinoplanes aureus]MBG0564454.1 hypothetical protein [Actinoplanes aureus]
MAGRTRVQLLTAVGHVVLLIGAIATVAVGFAIVTTRFAGPGIEFAVALATTVAVSLYGSLVASSTLHRRLDGPRRPGAPAAGSRAPGEP